MSATPSAWYTLKDTSQLVSPSLLVYPERVQQNIDAMLQIVGNPARLRPHVKTHKTAEIIDMQLEAGITKFKCATIPEAELLAKCKAKDVLLAMQPVGSAIPRLISLIKKYPETTFATLVDNEQTMEELSSAASVDDIEITIYIDLNTGMDRTGIYPSEEAASLYAKIYQNENLKAAGLHAYDGHIRHPNFAERKKACDQAFETVLNLKNKLEASGMEVKHMVLGGSSSFPIHAEREGVETSPGTTLLWDEGYGSIFNEMPFVSAAILATRIVSKPRAGVVCFDLGHKAIAPEMAFPRVKILGLEHAEQIGQSEEHLVVQYPAEKDLRIGQLFYAIPMHICPTVAKYPHMLAVTNGQVAGVWKVVARDH